MLTIKYETTFKRDFKRIVKQRINFGFNKNRHTQRFILSGV